MSNILTVLIFFPLIAGLFGFLVSQKSIRVYVIAVAAAEFFIIALVMVKF